MKELCQCTHFGHIGHAHSRPNVVTSPLRHLFPPFHWFWIQMFEEEQDRGVTEEELECILHTALGVTELRVSRLFHAVDVANSGKVTFGKRTGSGVAPRARSARLRISAESKWAELTQFVHLSV